MMKEVILDNTFFWNFSKRQKFFINTISLKLSDSNFLKCAKDLKICGTSWDKACTKDFQKLVENMNDYREKMGDKEEKNRQRMGRRERYAAIEPYDGDSTEDYMRCICGGYTHIKQIKEVLCKHTFLSMS